VAVKSLVLDAMPNRVCSSTGAGSPSRRTPYPFAITRRPSLTMATESPGTVKVFMTLAT